MGPNVSAEEVKARVLVEKKTILNLVDAFCVAVKHYLRGEEGMLCILKIYIMLDSMSSQISSTWTYIIQPNIFHHTHFPRVCHPIPILRAC